MPELLEASVADIAGPDSTECPFDCGTKKCNAKNNFERGQGFKISSQNNKLKKIIEGVPTIQYKEVDGGFESDETKIASKKIPEDIEGHPNECGWTAHHLIPVGVIRKHYRLRKFLEQENSSIVACNVGYEVNGVTNGLWLIGSRSLVDYLEKDAKDLISESLKRAGIVKKGKQSPYTAMSNHAKPKKNAKIEDTEEWNEDVMEFRKYLFETMEKYKRQFHDSHGEYNKFVKLVLGKVCANLARLRRACLINSNCQNYPKKPMAPHRIVERLDNISKRLSSHLIGSANNWKEPLFTSKFAKMYAIEEQTNKKSL